MYIDYEYWQHDPRLFPGYYHSFLFDSDELWEMEEHDKEEGIITENQCYEVDEDYFNAMSATVTNVLFEYVKGEGIIQDAKFKKLNSPAYYNYENDKLVVDLKIDLDKLKDWAIEREEELKKYVQKYHSSYDGYVSYVRYEDIDQFFARWTDIVIDFYLITAITINEDFEENRLDDYYMELREATLHLLYVHLIACDNSTDDEIKKAST